MQVARESGPQTLQEPTRHSHRTRRGRLEERKTCRYFPGKTNFALLPPTILGRKRRETTRARAVSCALSFCAEEDEGTDNGQRRLRSRVCVVFIISLRSHFSHF